MVNMKMSAKEAQEWTQPTPADAPEYPWGLCLDLDEESLTKLGITSLPAVGTTMTLQALVTVTRTSSSSTQGDGQRLSMGLQVTDMEIAPAQRSAADRLFGEA